MKRNLLLVLGLVLFLPATALAKGEGVGLGEVIKALETPFQAGTSRDGAIYDFEADFFQQSSIASLDRVQRGRGRVAIKFDRSSSARVPMAKFRWDYGQPTTQEIVSDGRTMWVYLPENRQVIQSDIEQTSRSRSDDPMTFLTGLGNLSRDFLISWAAPNQDVEGNYVLEMRPRRPSSLIQRLLIVVDREAVLDFARQGAVGEIFPIRSTTVYDPNGNSTLIEFSEIRLNRGLDDGLFDFILPAGVEVLRPTGREMGF